MCNPIGAIRRPKAKTKAREAADAYLVAYNAHDLDTFSAFYAPDAVFVSPDAGEIKGREAIAAYHKVFLVGFPDAKIEILGQYDDGDVVVDEWIFRGTHTGPLPLPTGDVLEPTGRRIAVRGADVGVYKDGQITGQRMYFDQAALASELGLLPS